MPMPNQRKFDLVKQYLGDALVEYSLNGSIPFADLTDNQIQSLEMLYNTIQQARNDFIQQNGLGDGFLFNILQKQGIFADCRTLCGGSIPNIQRPEDPLLDFILRFAVKLYPLLLLKPVMNFSLIPINFSVMYTLRDMDKFVDLFKQDILDNLTNKSPVNMEYVLDFRASNGISVNLHVSTLYIQIISKCFQNCCYKMRYDFDSLAHEVEESLEKLRNLARGDEETFSIFVGASGLTLQGVENIELQNCIMWPVARFFIPAKNIDLVLSTTSDGNISGTIIEIVYRIKIIKDQSSEGISCFMTQQLHTYEKDHLELLKFAICFSSEESYAFIFKFSENSFPLAPAGNYSHDPYRFPKKFTTISGQESIATITGWYNKLLSIRENKNIRHIQIPLDRLSYAIHERDNPVDGFVDALIAWEALFSGTPETTFKVTGAITKFLNPLNKKDFLKDLREIYANRSAIVHGGKRLDPVEAEELRLKAIKIGLDCLKKLIWIEEYSPLLQMSSAHRCDEIMVYDSHLLV